MVAKTVTSFMSRLAKRPITIPPQTTVSVGVDGVVSVQGPKGTLTRRFRPEVAIEKQSDDVLMVSPARPTRFARVLWGTYASHLRNMVQGVNQHYEKKLIIEGVGFKWDVSGNVLTLSVGFSHPVVLPVPEGITVAIEKSELTVSGADKEAVGAFAADIRSRKKPEPYKGKGIRYSDEVIRRKQGKKSA